MAMDSHNSRRNSNSSNASNQIDETTSLLPGGSPRPKWRSWSWSWLSRRLGALVVAVAAFATAAVVLLGLLGLWKPDRFGGYEVWVFPPFLFVVFGCVDTMAPLLPNPLSAFLCFALTLTCPGRQPQQPPSVNLTYTTYEGVRLSNGVDAFLGMRYAAAPVGDLRWRAPVEPPRTDGVEKASRVCNSVTTVRVSLPVLTIPA